MKYICKFRSHQGGIPFLARIIPFNFIKLFAVKWKKIVQLKCKYIISKEVI